jgi:hypothetical protein
MNKRERPPSENPYLLPLSILLSGAMIAGAILYTQWPERSPSGGPSPTATAPPAEPRDLVVDIADAPRRGRAAARLVLIEFSDYQ